MKIWLYILVMALVTYLIRALPLVMIRRRIGNRFLRSFLYYVPYATLAAMTFPAILFSTDRISGAVIGLAAAVCLALRGRSLLLVAGGASIAVLIAEFIPSKHPIHGLLCAFALE